VGWRCTRSGKCVLSTNVTSALQKAGEVVMVVMAAAAAVGGRAACLPTDRCLSMMSGCIKQRGGAMRRLQLALTGRGARDHNHPFERVAFLNAWGCPNQRRVSEIAIHLEQLRTCQTDLERARLAESADGAEATPNTAHLQEVRHSLVSVTSPVHARAHTRTRARTRTRTRDELGWGILVDD
jgi:hypothetical protein